MSHVLYVGRADNEFVSHGGQWNHGLGDTYRMITANQFLSLRIATLQRPTHYVSLIFNVTQPKHAEERQKDRCEEGDG